jgi:hypothetical protein
MAQHDLKGFLQLLLKKSDAHTIRGGFIQSFHAFSGLICNRFDDFQGKMGCGQPNRLKLVKIGQKKPKIK